MKLKVGGALIGAVTALATFHLGLRAETARVARPGARSVWDSVFTAAQAARGDSLYQGKCVTCHGPALAGTTDGAPLAGSLFLQNWNGLSLAELADKIYTTMPSDKPKTLSQQEVADVMASILNANKFPAGAVELPPVPDSLKNIKLETSRP